MSSSTEPTNPVPLVAPQASTNKKKNKKKKSSNKSSKPAASEEVVGNHNEIEHDDVSDPAPPDVYAREKSNNGDGKPDDDGNDNGDGDGDDDPATAGRPDSNGNGHATANGHLQQASDTTTAKLEAMSQEREALRQEVEQLRKQLEGIQETHDQEVARLRSSLDESEAAKEHAETQYQTLLGRVEKIKETLGDRLKRDKAELEEAKDKIDELEAQNEELQQGAAASQDRVAGLEDEVQAQARELSELRSRGSLSQQNWAREKDDMARQLQHLKGELESTSNAMGEWEVIAMEERSVRESLTDKVADLEEQLAAAREAYERAAEERGSQSQAIDGLQRALQEIQEARRRELREMVESSEQQLQEARTRAHDADARAAEAESARESLSAELQRTAPFEKEVKEKNLLIGKLRHEAIVLNDHLTKALKYIKKTKPEETIDRQIVTNHFLQFLSLDRSDPKKFQILQVIAGLLNWTDEQREQAGLARPGTSSHTLRLPTSPFHRTPSSPALNTDFFSETNSASGKESLADLWAGFLERSVEDAGGESGSRIEEGKHVQRSGHDKARPERIGKEI